MKNLVVNGIGWNPKVVASYPNAKAFANDESLKHLYGNLENAEREDLMAQVFNEACEIEGVKPDKQIAKPAKEVQPIEAKG